MSEITLSEVAPTPLTSEQRSALQTIARRRQGWLAPNPLTPVLAHLVYTGMVSIAQGRYVIRLTITEKGMRSLRA